MPSLLKNSRSTTLSAVACLEIAGEEVEVRIKGGAYRGSDGNTPNSEDQNELWIDSITTFDGHEVNKLTKEQIAYCEAQLAESQVSA